jgi:outer membrane protein assembly factor BamA
MAADQAIPNASPDHSQIQWVGLPLFYSTPESGFALGGLFMGYRNQDPASPQGKQDLFSGAFFVTQKEQIIGYLDFRKYFQGDRSLFLANIGYIDFPGKFFGIGQDSNKYTKEDYTLIQRAFSGGLLWKLAQDFYLGPYISYGRLDIEDQTPGGLLASGEIAGSDGTTVAGSGLRLFGDTRDDQFMPRHGSVIDAMAMSYQKNFGSDEDFSQLSLTYKHFWPMGPAGTFAFMSLTTVSEGNVPFEMMPCLGGSNTMRGYYSGYYRDKDYAALQGEYRYPISARLGGAIFVGLGEVASKIDEFSLDRLKTTAGFGFRYQLVPNQKVKLRLDIGFSETGNESYLNFMEAF